MKTDIKSITINGVEYVEKTSNTSGQLAKKTDGMDYVVVRGDRSGVFVGYMKKKDGREITLVNCRRLFYWNGAASLSQLATEGVTKPKDCKFTVPANILVLDAIEILSVTEAAKKILEGVAVWKM